MRNFEQLKNNSIEELNKKQKELSKGIEEKQKVYSMLDALNVSSLIEPDFIYTGSTLYNSDVHISFKVENLNVLREIIDKMGCNVNRNLIKNACTSLPPFLGMQNENNINGYVLRIGEWDNKIEYYFYYNANLYQINLKIDFDMGIKKQCHTRYVQGQIYEKQDCRLILDHKFSKFKSIRWSRVDKKYFPDFTLYCDTVLNTGDLIANIFNLKDVKKVDDLTTLEKMDLFKDKKYIDDYLREMVPCLNNFKYEFYTSSYRSITDEELYLKTSTLHPIFGNKLSLYVPIKAMIEKDIEAIIKRNTSYWASYVLESSYKLNREVNETLEQFNKRKQQEYKGYLQVLEAQETKSFLKCLKKGASINE